jgi:hypothetical protein
VNPNLLNRPSKHNEDFNIAEITEKRRLLDPSAGLLTIQARGWTRCSHVPLCKVAVRTTINRHMGGEKTC